MKWNLVQGIKLIGEDIGRRIAAFSSKLPVLRQFLIRDGWQSFHADLEPFIIELVFFFFDFDDSVKFTGAIEEAHIASKNDVLLPWIHFYRNINKSHYKWHVVVLLSSITPFQACKDEVDENLGNHSSILMMISLKQKRDLVIIDLVHSKPTQNKQSLPLNLAFDIFEYSKALTLWNVYLLNLVCFYVISQKGLRDHFCMFQMQPSLESELFLNAQPTKEFLLANQCIVFDKAGYTDFSLVLFLKMVKTYLHDYISITRHSNRCIIPDEFVKWWRTDSAKLLVFQSFTDNLNF